MSRVVIHRSFVGRLVSILVGAIYLSITSGCAHSPSSQDRKDTIAVHHLNLKAAKSSGPALLRLKADPVNIEKVQYFNRTESQSFEDGQLRHKKEETLKFSSHAETIASDPDKSQSKTGVGVFTQALSSDEKDGTADLHDFALPEPGEKLKMTFNDHGKILLAEGYPSNSIFYVSPLSLPDGAVSIGDTWTMQASWLSLNEMIPYQLDMVSILKGLWECGKHTCAEIEISGDVGFQGSLSQAMTFHSNWRGTIYFDIDEGTIVWSRTDSEERLVSDNVRREVSSCLESLLVEPKAIALQGLASPSCEPFNKKVP
jgi:hypothetical protein